MCSYTEQHASTLTPPAAPPATTHPTHRQHTNACVSNPLWCDLQAVGEEDVVAAAVGEDVVDGGVRSEALECAVKHRTGQGRLVEQPLDPRLDWLATETLPR